MRIRGPTVDEIIEMKLMFSGLYRLGDDIYTRNDHKYLGTIEKIIPQGDDVILEIRLPQQAEKL